MTGYEDLLQGKKQYHFDPHEVLDDGSCPSTGETRNKCLMHHDDELKSFFTCLNNNIIACLEAASINTDKIIPYIMKTWCTMLDYSDDIREHTHACSDLSFVYYVDPPPDSFIVFGNPNNNLNKYFDGVYDPRSPRRSLKREFNFINTQYNTLSVSKGDLLLFPSKLPHYVKSCDGSGTYLRSVAGDVKLMLHPDYTDLDPGLIHYSHWRSFG